MKNKILQLIQAKGENFIDYIELLEKMYNEMPSEICDQYFADCERFGEAREKLELFEMKLLPYQKEMKRKKSEEHKLKNANKSKQKQTYLKLTGYIEKVTDKAYGIAVGTNGCITKNKIRVYVEWIPKAQTVKESDNIYVAQWLIASNRLWEHVDKNDKIER